MQLALQIGALMPNCFFVCAPKFLEPLPTPTTFHLERLSLAHQPITGCAVAQHCYNGDVSFLWENGKFDACKIETLEQIDTEFVSIDYVHERNVCSKFGKNPFTEDFWTKG